MIRNLKEIEHFKRIYTLFPSPHTVVIESVFVPASPRRRLTVTVKEIAVMLHNMVGNLTYRLANLRLFSFVCAKIIIERETNVVTCHFVT